MNTLITGNTKFYSQTQNREFIEVLRRNPPFTPQQEVDAFKRLYAGDERALGEIVARNQRWVYSVAKEFARDEIEVMDYVQEGNIGLLKAIEKYDLSKGLKFITYAVWYMRREMNAHMNTGRDLITKSNNAKYGKKLERIKNEFFVQNGYKATFDDIKEIFEEKYGIVVNDERDLYDLDISSINENVNDDTTFEECDDFTKATATENEATNDENKEYFRELVNPILDLLPEKHRELIKKLYHIGYNEECSFDELCKEYNIHSEEELRQTEKNILDVMRDTMLKRYKKAV
jgi:RNA polymerase primary sigma factor